MLLTFYAVKSEFQLLTQPRTQGLTYGKDPGWGWSRDFTKIDWLRGEGRVSNCMLPQKTLHFNYKEWIRVI
jgi:hypothetical protein